MEALLSFTRVQDLLVLKTLRQEFFSLPSTIDLSRSGAKHRGTQSYLLARPLATNPAKLSALKSFFRDVWVLEGKFTIQSCEENLFLLSFDLKKDRNRVIWGGPWNFHHAPVVLQEYDGIAPFDEIPMTLLYFWVRILQIPPLYSTKPMIKDITPVAGKYIDTDHKLFRNTKKARVFVAHDIAQPFFLKKKLQLDVNVEKEIHFFYENMASICEHCNLIYHVEDRCPLGKQIPKAPGLQIPSLKVTPVGGLGNLMETNFRFQGGLPNPTSLPFGAGATLSKARRLIILKKKLFQEEADSSAGELSLEHANVEKGTTCPSSGPAQTLCLDMILEDEVELEAESVMPTDEADSVVQTGEADSVVPTSEANKQQALTLALPLAPMSLKMVVKRQ